MSNGIERYRFFIVALAAAVTVTIGGIGSLAAETGERDNVYGSGWVGVLAILFAALHLSAPLIRRILRRMVEVRIVESIGNGLAVGYVALQLLPELEEGEELLGSSHHYILLAGFIIFRGLEQRFVAAETTDSPSRSFKLHMALGCIYNWLLIYAMPSDLQHGVLVALIGGLPIMIHLAHSDFVHGTQETEMFDRWGRYALAMAPIVGWLTFIIAEPSEWLSDMFIAILAGYLMQSVMTVESSDATRTSFRWFLAGACTYVLLSGFSLAAQFSLGS